MTGHELLKLVPASVIGWPVTYRYRIFSTWGETQLDLTMNIPVLENDVEATRRFGAKLWGVVFAGASSFLTRVAVYESTMWKLGITEFDAPQPGIFGMQPSLPAGRGETPAMQMHTGHQDSLGVRRLPVPGVPRSWVSDGLVTDDGLRRIENTAHVLKIGTASPELGGPIHWLIAYENVEWHPHEPPLSVGFRSVQYVRVLHHTLRAPDPSL